MNSSQIHEIAIEVKPSDIDEMGHVNNIVYLHWVQEAAIAHWQFLAPPAEQEKVMWVVLRHEIDYKAPAWEGDIITARTWIGKAKRLSFERNTEIMRSKDSKLLARARTIWCPVHSETGKPVRVSEEIRKLFSAE